MSTGLEFEHRSSDSPLIEQVWRSRSTGATTMMSVARAHWDLVFWEDSKGLHAGVQGPETRASEAPVPQGASFLGVRFALGTRLSGLSPSSLVDRFTTLPIACGEVRIGPDQVRLPRYNDAEDFVELLLRRELVLVSPLDDAAVSSRTRQRRYLHAVGMPFRTVQQIARAHDAAVLLQHGRAPVDVVQECGYFDQPHLARSVRRFIGNSAGELARESPTMMPLSLLYKTRKELAGYVPHKSPEPSARREP
ncbi:helix-turn-helix domain-containing protein [Microbacterium sp. 22303]|uniref:helix-turn-helix domain-containing protein n=1 Tax=Microbacterium sp. 22303 TaxID=3453905 RepID=UPI003F82C8A2